MHRWWNRLDETKIPNYLQLLSLWINTRAENLFNKNHIRTVVIYLLIGWFFLTAAYFIQNIAPFPNDKNFVAVTPSNQEQNLKPQGFFDKLELPHALCFIPLFISDSLTIMLTLAMLRKLKRSRKFLNTLAIIILNIAVTTVLAIVCFTSVIYADEFAVNHDLIGMHYGHKEEELAEINAYNYFASHKMLNVWFGPQKIDPIQFSTNTTVIYFREGNSWLTDVKQTPLAIFTFFTREA
jgi:hypothetical protein